MSALPPKADIAVRFDNSGNVRGLASLFSRKAAHRRHAACRQHSLPLPQLIQVAFHSTASLLQRDTLRQNESKAAHYLHGGMAK
jgi:hypothetical protein